MSFTVVEQAPARLNRSELAVPGSSPQFFEKAAKSAADVVFLDLEDAVAPDKKEQARKNIVQGINEIDWGTKTLSVRINGLDTPYMYRDVVDVLEQAGDRLDLIMIPKVGTAADVYAVDMLVTQIEQAKGRKKRIGFELIIETALGMANIDEIARASRAQREPPFRRRRLRGQHARPHDRHRRPEPGLRRPDRQGRGRRAPHPLGRHVALRHRPHGGGGARGGSAAIDGPFGDFSDPDGFRAQARRSAVLGCEGKWAIHPSQVTLANEVFTPPEKEVERARRILQAMAQARQEGKGAVVTRRQADRHRLDPPGRAARRHRRPDRQRRLSRWRGWRGVVQWSRPTGQETKRWRTSPSPASSTPPASSSAIPTSPAASRSSGARAFPWRRCSSISPTGTISTKFSTASRPSTTATC